MRKYNRTQKPDQPVQKLQMQKNTHHNLSKQVQIFGPTQLLECKNSYNNFSDTAIQNSITKKKKKKKRGTNPDDKIKKKF